MIRTAVPLTPSGVTRAAGLATAATVLGYGTTLLQQLVYARALGVGSDTDALAAALVWGIAVTGTIGSIFAGVVIPPYSRALNTDPGSARELFRTASTIGLLIAAAFAVGTVLLAGPLSQALLPGSERSSQSQLESLLRLTSPLLVLWVAVVTLSALANAHERYVITAIATVVPSIPVIIALSTPNATVEIAAVAYSFGAVAQLCVLGWAVRTWWRDYLPLPTRDGLDQFWTRVPAIAIAFVTLNLMALATRAIASLAGTGDVAVFDYATRLTMAVEQLILSGLLAVSLTTWSADASYDQLERLPIRKVLLFATGSLPFAAIALALFGGNLVGLLFEGGNFSAQDAARLGEVLAWIAAGMAARMMLLLTGRGHLARGTGLGMLLPAAIGLAVLLPLAIAAEAAFGIVGVSVAYSISWSVAAVASILMLGLGRATDLELLREFIAASTAAAAAGLLAYTLTLPLRDSNFWVILLGGSVYLAMFLAVGGLFRLHLITAPVRLARSRLGASHLGSKGT